MTRKTSAVINKIKMMKNILYLEVLYPSKSSVIRGLDIIKDNKDNKDKKIKR